MFATVLGVLSFIAYIVGIIIVWFYIVDNDNITDAFDVIDDFKTSPIEGIHLSL